MNPTVRGKQISVFVFTLLSVAACSSVPALKQFERTNDLPEDLPAEIKGQFQIEPTVGTALEVAQPELPAPAVVQPSEPVPTDRPEKQKPKAKPAQAKGFQYPNRRTELDPIWVDEKLTYEISYFGVAAGLFTMSVKPFKEINHRRVYHFSGRAQSSKFFSLFYRIDDEVESFLDFEGLFSHRFHLVMDESKQTRNSLELYDSERKRTFYWNRWNHHQKGYTETKNFFPMEPFPQDTLSSLYYLRTQPLKVGTTVKFLIQNEGKAVGVEARVLRKEMLSTPLGKIQTIVIQPDTRFEGVLKREGESFIWISDDDRRFVVKLEAKVRIGKVTATLKEIEPGTPPPQ